MPDSEATFSGRVGYDCPNCDRVVSIYDREYHRNVECSGGGHSE